MDLEWGQNFNLIVTWTWKSHSNQLQVTPGHSDQSQQPYQIDQSTSANHNNPTENINSKISHRNISYFSLYLVHKSILEDMSNYVNSVQVFEVLPTEKWANCNQSLILSNLKPFAKYELYVTATNEFGQSARSNSLLFVNSEYIFPAKKTLTELSRCSDPSWGGGGGNYILKWVFFVQSILADRYIHRRELRLVSLESLSSVEYGIKKIFLIFVFDREISRFKLSRK